MISSVTVFAQEPLDVKLPEDIPTALSISCNRPSKMRDGNREVTLSWAPQWPHKRYDYPPSLEKEKVARIFEERVRKYLLPYLKPDANCQIRDLVFYPDSLAHDFFLNAPDTRNIILSLRISELETEGEPAIAILSYREWTLCDCKRSFSLALHVMLNSENQIAIPLNLADEEITRRVTALADRLAGKKAKNKKSSPVHNAPTGKKVVVLDEAITDTILDFPDTRSDAGSRPSPPKMIPLPAPPEEGESP